ncbi:MAG: transketolase [Planctomycetota bacterium]
MTDCREVSDTAPMTTSPWTWESEQLSDGYLAWHETARRECLRDILQMTHLASSGHPGGSMSSLDFYLVIYAHANLDPADPWMHDRDRIVVSHGHTSPGVYSVLCRLGYFERDAMISGFRRTFDRFEGHIERDVPGVEWTTGNLGQGLSAASGMALGMRLKGVDGQLFVPMGDGEQQKGQISEARRFIRKFELNNVTAVVDLNHQQIGGRIEDIMPQDIAAGWRSDGWHVTEIDGHDPTEIHRACREAVLDTSKPHCILARTDMGKGISFMEGTHKYHGVALSDEQYAQAAEESCEDAALWDLTALRERAAAEAESGLPPLPHVYPVIDPGTPRTYEADQKADNRGAFGNAMLDVAEANRNGDFTPIAAFDCDLEGSVKLGAFHETFPGHFFQSGIQEHHTATCSGALSCEEIVTVFADFGVFGVCETYNQHRLTDINHGHLKLACTHIGLDVGEDGRTHQCIDYIGVLANLFGMNIIVPADPNQTDRALRHMLCEPGMFFLGMGRSKLPTILDENGQPFFAGDYQFEMGKLDWIRRGSAGTVVATGTLTQRAVEAVDQLRAGGLDVGVACLATPTFCRDEDLDALAASPFLVTVEDHSVATGLGAHLAQNLFDRGHAVPHRRLGVENYCPSGSAESVYRSQGLDVAGLVESVRAHAASSQ